MPSPPLPSYNVDLKSGNILKSCSWCEHFFGLLGGGHLKGRHEKNLNKREALVQIHVVFAGIVEGIPIIFRHDVPSKAGA